MKNRKLRGEFAMPWLAADPVIVLPAHREALEALVRAHSTSQQLALRARMILHAADNIGVRESARELDVWPNGAGGGGRRLPPNPCRTGSRMRRARAHLRHTPPSRFAR